MPTILPPVNDPLFSARAAPGPQPTRLRVPRLAATIVVSCVLGSGAGCAGSEGPSEGTDPAGSGKPTRDDGTLGCEGLTGCGENNFLPVDQCTHCPRRADAQACEAGTCRALETNPGGLIEVVVAAPERARAAQGATIAAILPTMADGSRLTCARLFDEGFLDRPTINVVNARVQALLSDPSLGTPVSILTEPGPDQLVLMTLTETRAGDGAALATGCQEGVAVEKGKKTRVALSFLW